MSNTNKNVVMLVDDSNIDAFINQKMIQNFEFADKIYVQNSSVGALDFFKNFERLPELPHSLLPTIIFLDISMPDLNGFEFLHELAKINQTITSNIKIVIVTSSTNLSDIDKASEFKNVVMFLSKPLTVNHLKELQKILN